MHRLTASILALGLAAAFAAAPARAADPAPDAPAAAPQAPAAPEAAPPAAEATPVPDGGLQLQVPGADVAQPEPQPLPAEDPAVRAELMARRFAPFDKAAGTQWAADPPEPILKSLANATKDAFNVALTPGSYMLVVLCNCQIMDVTLVGPDGAAVPPSRSNEQAAMYSLDVAKAGDWLAGVDMNDCAQTTCGVAVKVYRKK